MVVISDGLFQRRYGGDPDAVGRTLHINGRPYTLIGVIPERSGYPMDGAVWIPLIIDDLAEQERLQGMLTVLGGWLRGSTASDYVTPGSGFACFTEMRLSCH